MSHRFRSRIPLYLVSILCGLLLGLLFLARPARTQAASYAGETPIGTVSAPLLAERSASAQAPVPEACPAGPFDLPKIIARPDFCVYYSLYDASTNPNGLTVAQATHAADLVATFWTRYVTDFGFLPPTYSSPKLPVWMVVTAPGNCWGVAYGDHIEVATGCFAIGGQEEHIIGHELFHRFQASYPPDRYAVQRWLYEGSAVAVTDNALLSTDNWANYGAPGSLAYNLNVDVYLGNTNMSFTSFKGAYESALWWKYLTEQYGATPGEPQLGVDALRRLWEANPTKVGIAAVNQALADLGAGVTFNDVFKRFVVANLTKDLSNLPDGSYNYVDEEQVGNPKQYGPVAVYPATISSANPLASWNNHQVVPFGASYYQATVAGSCPVVSASFHRDNNSPAFYHVVTQKGNVFEAHVEGSGADWTPSFLNDGLTRVTAIAGSLYLTSEVDISLGCASPTLDVKLPNSGAVAHVQPGSKLLAQVLVTDGSPSGPVVAGLHYEFFRAKVGGVDAAVVTGGFVQEQYWLIIKAPDSLADGTYSLEVILQAPSSGVPLASDTNLDSVVYSSGKVDHVLVIDRSGSMGYGAVPRLPAAKDAARFYVDITRQGDGLAIVPYNENVAPAPFALGSVTPLLRAAAKEYISGLSAGGWTSIGDGLQEAVNQRASSPTGNPVCSFVLLSDGMENKPLYWDNVQAAVKASGCPVTAIAFGPESNETLMQGIANATGGPMLYNDVSVSAQALAPGLLAVPPSGMALDLGNSYEYAQGRSEGRQRLLAGQGEATSDGVNTHLVWVDDTVSEAVLALDWYQEARVYSDLAFQLVAPDGTIIDPATVPYTFEDIASGHKGWRISDPMPGQWELRVTILSSLIEPVPYQVLASGQSQLTLDLLLLDRLGLVYQTGNRVPIYAFLSSNQPLRNAQVEAFVTSPDGTLTRVRLHDDGQHGDGAARDGLYANLYTRVNRAEVVFPSGEPSPFPPNDEGGYRLRVVATGPGFQREALGSFSVQEGPDSNGNGLPDAFEREFGVTDPRADPDGDLLTTAQEYEIGTDPTDADTDRGGEADGSEAIGGQDPLNAEDDLVRRPDCFQAEPGNGVVALAYDVKDDYSNLELYRTTDPAGGWELVTAALPRNGIYTDTVPNGQTFYYRFQAYGRGMHIAPGLESGAVTPREDPYSPEVQVVINGGAAVTRSPLVTLTFVPRGEGILGIRPNLDDVVEMMASNDPFYAGAQWQVFEREMPWQLDGAPGQFARVFARFRDAAGNVSVGTVASILYDLDRVYLPLVSRGWARAAGK